MSKKASGLPPSGYRIEGPAVAADLLIQLPEVQREKILYELESKDPKMAEILRSKVEESITRFEKVFELESRNFLIAFQKIPRELWVLALRGLPKENQEWMRAQLPTRTFEELMEEVQSQGLKRVSEIETARKTIGRLLNDLNLK